MTLQFHNSLTRKKEIFEPLAPGKVKMYVCGITAWDVSHLGHARAAVTFDMMVKYMRWSGLHVTYVRNFTDVDDKIINRANKEGRDWKEIAAKYMADYSEAMTLLGCAPPDVEPKASAHIDDMIAMIETLIQNGHAYASGGDVFFAVRSFPGYGKLSGKNIEDLESGARVEVQESKRDPLDFALWKAVKPGEPAWDSPWGAGRPGWHIECSCMSKRFLGETFDIHGGGRDLIFPHHENEIAQSEAANDTEFARYWLHNGTLDINAEKMSKSLGNYFTVRDVLAAWDPEVIRYFLLSAHYRSPLNYSDHALHDAKTALDRIYETSARLEGLTQDVDSPELRTAFAQFDDKFREVMDDDFNTPKAYALVFELVRDLNRHLDQHKPALWMVEGWQKVRTMLAGILGFAGSNAAQYFERQKQLASQKRGVDPAQIEQLLADRKAARAAKDFKKSDEIRDQLTSMGVTIKDRPDGTTEWKIN